MGFFFFYLVFQISDSILWFIQSTIYSFQCILHFRYYSLHLWLVPFYGLCVLFHAVVVLTKFFWQPHNHFFKSLYLVNFLLSFHLALFLEISLVSFGTFFFVSRFWLPLFVCFYVLARSALTPSLSGVVLCSRWCSLLDHLIWMLQEFPLCGFCGPSCCNSIWIAIGSFLYGIAPQGGWLWDSTLITVCELLCRSWSHEAVFPSAGFGVFQDPSLNMLLVKLIGSYSDLVWSSPLGVLVSWSFRKESGDGQMRPCLWLALSSCLEPQIIHSLCLPVLGFGVHGKNRAVPQGWLYQH